MADFGDWYRSVPEITRYWFTGTTVLPLLGRFGLFSPYYMLLEWHLFFYKFQYSKAPKRNGGMWRTLGSHPTGCSVNLTEVGELLPVKQRDPRPPSLPPHYVPFVGTVNAEAGLLETNVLLEFVTLSEYT
ncbi:Derlin-1 [Toxocara canis]|uniref:Derlin n=1 Tax=Toxocara canis TaxID=6265 RepID=A0A0B2UU79_TOXCA|nr:Derlin-1 [Toxocara canis]